MGPCVLGVLVLIKCIPGVTANCVEKYGGHVLDCRHNNLTDVADIDVPNDVTDLILDHNNIDKLQNNAFSGKCSVEILFMNYNYISLIHPLAFTCLGALQELSIENNSLTKGLRTKFNV